MGRTVLVVVLKVREGLMRVNGRVYGVQMAIVDVCHMLAIVQCLPPQGHSHAALTQYSELIVEIGVINVMSASMVLQVWMSTGSFTCSMRPRLLLGVRGWMCQRSHALFEGEAGKCVGWAWRRGGATTRVRGPRQGYGVQGFSDDERPHGLEMRTLQLLILQLFRSRSSFSRPVSTRSPGSTLTPQTIHYDPENTLIARPSSSKHSRDNV